MYPEYPNVVQLNVGGTHCQTLLSTLTSEDGSDLAAMFTGRKNIFKDENDRYFIDSDWNIFKYILEYLQQDGNLDFNIDAVQTGLFGGGFRNGFGTVNLSQTDIMIRLHREAKRFGIKGLVKKLEQHQTIFTKLQIESFQQQIPNFEETVDKVLSCLTGQFLLSYDTVIIQLCQDFQGSDQTCCEHTCYGQTQSAFGFGTHMKQLEVDEKIKVPYKVTVPIFKSICMALMTRGFTVNGRVVKCGHRCKRPYSTQGGFSFGTSPSCNEVLYLIQITWNIIPVHIFQQPFGRQQQHTGGFSFGGPQTTGSGLFGGQPAQQSAVGSSGDTCFAFGQPAQQTGFGFGSSQPTQQSTFVGGGYFGSKTTQQSAFGNTGGGLFGSQSTQPSAFGNTGGGLFGSQSTQPSAFGSAGGGLFGSPPSQQSSFGSTAGNPFGKQQNTSSAQSSSFGFGAVTTGNDGPFNSSSSVVGVGSNNGGGFGLNVNNTGFGSSPGTPPKANSNGLLFGYSNASGTFGSGCAKTKPFGSSMEANAERSQQANHVNPGGSKTISGGQQSMGFTFDGGIKAFTNSPPNTTGQSKVTISPPSFTFGRSKLSVEQTTPPSRTILHGMRTSQHVFGGPANFRNDLVQQENQQPPVNQIGDSGIFGRKKKENVSLFSGFGVVPAVSTSNSSEVENTSANADKESTTSEDTASVTVSQEEEEDNEVNEETSFSKKCI